MRPFIAIIGRRASRVPILRFSATIAAEAMCEAVYAGGGEPAVFHGLGDGPGSDLAERLARFDGVLMPGGADLGSEHYGQTQQPETINVVPFQDTLDIAVTRIVLNCEQPMFSICRGMQVLNVVCGGTLLQNQPVSSVNHRNAVHEVALTPGSRIHWVADTTRIDVSSYHHQVLGDLGDGLSVTGRSADGVIEAVEHQHANVLAVQWHPEDLHATSSTDAALFGDLVTRAEEHRARR